jgi:hypothetical protein
MSAAIIAIFIILFLASSNRDHGCGGRQRKNR